MKTKYAQDEMTDLVVLSPSIVQLERRGNGTLDVIALVQSSDVIAAVELKAAGSPNLAQCRLFRSDVMKLAELRRSVPQDQPFEAHSVLVDKALSIHPHLQGRPALAVWERDPPGRARGPQLFLKNWTGGDQRVHVWDFAVDHRSSLAAQRPVVRHRVLIR